MQQMNRQGIEPAVPDPGAAAYLAQVLFEVGPVIPTGMGCAPISYGEIRSWQECSGVQLTAWESETLRRLSRAWVDQQHLAAQANCPAPYREVSTEDRQSRLDAQMRAAFGLLPAGGRKSLESGRMQ